MTPALAPPDEHIDSDAVARQLAIMALERRTPCEHVHASVRHGCATLTGTVDAASKKAAAEHAVRAVPGITRVLNHIEVC
jgi:osmotically-inducible protein OsmY